MSTLRTHFTFRVDTWTPDGESIVEHVACVEDYQVALATYRAACERWPGTPITLRHGARVMATRMPNSNWAARQVLASTVNRSSFLVGDLLPGKLDVPTQPHPPARARRKHTVP